jgi:hypothetical protein
MNKSKSPACSFLSDWIKLSLLLNEKTIFQGKNSSSIQSDQNEQKVNVRFAAYTPTSTSRSYH